ncbi:MAG: NAD(P)H-hydrate dehydratase [Fuerstiella sp.]|jgi:NAD(P)H-hydrate epimerase|nr:NAD(P)H-hydrate dehydratase [Fuerstiella sp.]MCP4513007.1 NAD(P)H-hydrate dehydratase [Fuerstiella sp.]MDG2126852.1 NAD(P)H-hydrate dehydratase [Fuerstiella sp.]
MARQNEPHSARLPDRAADAHKGTFGRVLIIGGSVGMSGAACLSATAALRGGAGLVSVAVPKSIQAIVASYEPSYMTIGLPSGGGGQLSDICVDDVRHLVADKDAIAVGPGLGPSKQVADLVLSLLRESECPVILDADALNVVAKYEMFARMDSIPPCILTPHPGEFSRLTGVSTAEIQCNREDAARVFAEKYKVVVVLKGAGTVVTDGNRVFVNSTGNSGMATGGSGDVLTGLIVSQVSQGMSLFDAASVAVHVHGRAGDLAAAELSERGLIASDLLRFLGAAWQCSGTDSLD